MERKIKKEIAATLQNKIQIFGTWVPAFQKGRGLVEDAKVCLVLYECGQSLLWRIGVCRDDGGRHFE